MILLDINNKKRKYILLNIFDRDQRSNHGLKNCSVVVVVLIVVVVHLESPNFRIS